eukprot:Colp12_sorted_trinity150504_noHs@19496
MQAIAKGSPCFLTGDFNTVPNSSTYKIMLTEEGFELRDSRHVAKGTHNGDCGTMTGFAPLWQENDNFPTIDYIWVAPQIQTIPQFAVVCELFRGRRASDHRPILADLEIDIDTKAGSSAVKA